MTPDITNRASSQLPTVEDVARSQTLEGESPTGGSRRGPAELERGTTIGRYVVVAPLGRGGMGVVYRAYDPDLDRQVAIKLVGLGALGTEIRDHARQRLLREAQTLAKLSHPNVAAVYDVGLCGDDVFLAMEYIPGTTLRAWLNAAERSPREVLAVYRAAGAGLAAAHSAGVVHRDFKPDNVMIGRDGRVRVLDFGLARVAAPAIRPSATTIMPSAEPVAVGLTHAGAVLGTPAYMSPEQDAGLDADPPSDQFSYCASLYEALYGELPFRSATYAALVVARGSGEVVLPPKLNGVAARVRRALLVGLRADPAQRHRDVDALLGQLRPRPWQSPAVRISAAVAAIAVAALGVTLAIRPAAADPGAACAAVDTEAAALWNPLRQMRITAAFVAVDPANGGALADQVAITAAAWSKAYATARGELCELASRPDGMLTQANAADQLQCLQSAANQLDSMLALYTITDDRSIVDHAMDHVSTVRAPASCATLAGGNSDAAELEAAKPIINRLLKAQASFNAGNVAEALSQASVAVQMARDAHSSALGYGLYVLGLAQGGTGDFETARRTFREAALAAAANHEDNTVADAWIAFAQLSFRDRVIDDRLRDALFNGRLAVARLAADDPRHAKLEYTEGTLEVAEGKLGDAVPHLEHAIAEFRRIDPVNNANDVVIAQNSLGLVYLFEGRWADAGQIFDRVGDVIRGYGANNPQLGIVFDNQGLLAAFQENWSDAERLEKEALRLFGPLGANHPLVAEGEFDLGELYAMTDRCALAAPHIARARAISEKVRGHRQPGARDDRAGDGLAWRVRAIDRWLAAHGKQATASSRR